MTSTNYKSLEIVNVFWLWISMLLPILIPGSWRPVRMPTRLFKGIRGHTVLGTACYIRSCSPISSDPCWLPRELQVWGKTSICEELDETTCQEVLAHLPLTAGESPFPVLGEAEEDSSTKPNPSHQPQPTPPSNWTWKHLVKTTSYLRLENVRHNFLAEQISLTLIESLSSSQTLDGPARMTTLTDWSCHLPSSQHDDNKRLTGNPEFCRERSSLHCP